MSFSGPHLKRLPLDPTNFPSCLESFSLPAVDEAANRQACRHAVCSSCILPQDGHLGDLSFAFGLLPP